MQNRIYLRDLIEKKLQAWWAEVFKRHDISLEDDFLELGGDSLSAMLFISRIHDEFDIEVPVERFFEQPATIATLAITIEQLGG